MQESSSKSVLLIIVIDTLKIFDINKVGIEVAALGEHTQIYFSLLSTVSKGTKIAFRVGRSAKLKRKGYSFGVTK